MNSHRFIAEARKTPIPSLAPVEGWKQVAIEECGEVLVPVGPFVRPGQPGYSARLFADPVYFGGSFSSPYREGELNGALLTVFARKSVAIKLAQAADSLPPHMGILVHDIFRPLTVQDALFKDLYAQYIAGKMPEAQAMQETQRFVSLPSGDSQKPSPHSTASQVDATLIAFNPADARDLDRLEQARRYGSDKVRAAAEFRREVLMYEKGMPLDMGTAFDAVQPETATRYYEEVLEKGGALSPLDQTRMQNRRIQFHLMGRFGFRNYCEEHWHYGAGGQFDAVTSGETAVYGAASYTEECRRWEAMRLGRYREWPRQHQTLRPESAWPRAHRLQAYRPDS